MKFKMEDTIVSAKKIGNMEVIDCLEGLNSAWMDLDESIRNLNEVDEIVENIHVSIKCLQTYGDKGVSILNVDKSLENLLGLPEKMIAADKAIEGLGHALKNMWETFKEWLGKVVDAIKIFAIKIWNWLTIRFSDRQKKIDDLKRSDSSESLEISTEGTYDRRTGETIKGKMIAAPSFSDMNEFVVKGFTGFVEGVYALEEKIVKPSDKSTSLMNKFIDRRATARDVIEASKEFNNGVLMCARNLHLLHGNGLSGIGAHEIDLRLPLNGSFDDGGLLCKFTMPSGRWSVGYDKGNIDVINSRERKYGKEPFSQETWTRSEFDSVVSRFERIDKKFRSSKAFNEFGNGRYTLAEFEKMIKKASIKWEDKYDIQSDKEVPRLFKEFLRNVQTMHIVFFKYVTGVNKLADNAVKMLQQVKKVAVNK